MIAAAIPAATNVSKSISSFGSCGASGFLCARDSLSVFRLAIGSSPRDAGPPWSDITRPAIILPSTNEEMVTALQLRQATLADQRLNELEVIGRRVFERRRVSAHQARSTAARSLRSQPVLAGAYPAIPIGLLSGERKVTEIGTFGHFETERAEPRVRIHSPPPFSPPISRYFRESCEIRACARFAFACGPREGCRGRKSAKFRDSSLRTIFPCPTRCDRKSER